MRLTSQQVLADINTLPENYKTKDIDRIIREYVKMKADVSLLRSDILIHQELHRIYYYVSLKQIKNVEKRMRFIHDNLIFEDWWHTDELINFVAALDFNIAMGYAAEYIKSENPFIRRWGYVMFISKLGRRHASELLPLMQDDDHYYVQMAQAWLIAELTVFETEYVFEWLSDCGLKYSIAGKAIQKICDSYRISDEWKEKFKRLRVHLKMNK